MASLRSVNQPFALVRLRCDTALRMLISIVGALGRWFYASERCFWSCLRIKSAEGVRFELTRPFGLPVFKTGAINRSATPPNKW